MEEIRRAAVAYHENLPEEKKRYARFLFNEMDKNGDGQIELDEYLEYLKKDNNTVLTQYPSLFTALDKDGNGSLDFEETITLYYIVHSRRPLICQSCNTILADVYFSCSECFFNDESASTYEICSDCYGGKKFEHNDGHIFCDNYTLLSRSRTLALKAPAKKRRNVLEKIEVIVDATSVAAGFGCSIM